MIPRLAAALAPRDRAFVCVAFLLVTGCYSAPFAASKLPLLKEPDPVAMRNTFAAKVPDHFVSDDTVIIHAPFHELAVLAVLRVNRTADTFELAGLNQLGVQIFEVGGDRNADAVRFAIPPLDQQKEILLSIAADVRRMYFDLVPALNSKVDIRPQFVRFRNATPQGTLIYEFGGQPSVLLDKRFAGALGTVWRVSYFDYVSAPAGLYPRGVVMDNARYHYQIVVKNRQWQSK